MNFLNNENNKYSAFNRSPDMTPAAYNREGGIALWDMPAQVSRAFNPIIFTRTRYYFATEGYTPSRYPMPNTFTKVALPSIPERPKRTLLRLAYPADKDITLLLKYENSQSTATIKKGETDVIVASRYDSIEGFVWNFVSEEFKPIQPDIPIIGGKSAVAAADLGDFVVDEMFEPTYKTTKILTGSRYIYITPGMRYSDANYIVNEEGEVLYITDKVDTSSITIYRDNGELGASLSAESFRGVTQFDVSAVVRMWFDARLADSDADFVRPAAGFADGRLFTRYTVKSIGGVGTSYDFLALNAVAQIGEQPVAEPGDYLSEMRTLWLYEGYPLDYSMLDASKGVVRTPVDASHLPAAGTVPFEVVQACVPAQPFYVRWVNRMGGVDYFMFCRRQTRKYSVKSASTHSLYVADPYRAGSNLRAWSLTTEHTMTVGADGLSDEEFGPLSALPFAPTIEWYDGGRWIEIAVSKFDGSFATHSHRHSFEITFTLPAINTQF